LLNAEQSSWVTPSGLSMKTRTVVFRPVPFTSACTSSTPNSAATRSANSLTRSSTDAAATRPSAQKTDSRAKEKVGANPQTPPPRSEQETNYTATRGKRAKAEQVLI